MKNEEVEMTRPTPKAAVAVEEKKLTPEQIQARHDVMVKIGMTAQAKALEEELAEVARTTGSVDALVMNPANPYLSLYREFRAGALTAAQLDLTICLAICQDEKQVRDFERKPMPTKPDRLLKDEAALREKLSPDQWAEGIEKLHRKLSQSDGKVEYYLRHAERLKAENASNLHWLQYFYELQKDKNQVYAARLLAAIDTHLAA